MSAECYPVSVLPHITRLYTDYLALAEQPADSVLRRWYPSEPLSGTWMKAPEAGSSAAASHFAAASHLSALADALLAQSTGFGAGQPALDNIEKLRTGASAVVTGQQVGLFGGPLLTLLKAATAVALAAEATERTGHAHVPVFWLATEDHDLEEVDQVSLLSKHAVERLRLGLKSSGRPVGNVVLGEQVSAVLDQVGELLAFAPIYDTLRSFYTPDATLGGAFARVMAKLFAAHGLIVMDAAGRDFHALGKPALRAAIERVQSLEDALIARTQELEAAGYHAQVLIKPGHSLLFLIDQETGQRHPLRHLPDGTWKAASNIFTEHELLVILDQAPERVSPNALLRPVLQDSILPTAAYVGGPAEIAYFAQSAVLYQAILGRLTPVLPRFSATIIEPAIASVMEKDEVSLKDIFEARTEEALAQRLGARAMPIEGKRRLAAVGNAMDAELGALTGYLEAMDESLGRSAEVSASKMRYQMNRLRRMAATFELQKEASLRKHAEAMTLHLLPEGHPQERVLGGIWFLAQGGEALIDRMVEEARGMCLGHAVVRI